jgi:hypothetical protein
MISVIREQGVGKMVARQTRRKPPPLPPSLEMHVFQGVFYAVLAFSLLSAVGYALAAR